MRHLFAAVVLAVALAGCGAATTATPSDVPSDATASIEADLGIPPRPDADTQAAFVAALDAIDPEIVNGKEDKAVSRGRDQCGSVKQSPDDRAKLVELTSKRFISPGHPDGFGEETSAKILDVVRKYICPTF